VLIARSGFLIVRSIHGVSRVAVIGDTVLDLQAGMNARAGWVVGVLTGAHPIEMLGATPHTHLLTSIAGPPALLGTPMRD